MFGTDDGAVNAKSCYSLHNRWDGVAVHTAIVTFRTCSSAHNGRVGYCIDSWAEHVETEASTSDLTRTGCEVSAGDPMATHVAATNSRWTEFHASEHGEAVQKSCSVTSTVVDGMLFPSASNRSCVEDCSLAEKSVGGMLATPEASVAVRGCRNRGIEGAGYKVLDHAQMPVSCVFNDGVEARCIVRGCLGAKLTMEEASVDGVVQSRMLPLR